MAANSTIEWTEKTWNPGTGCTKVSPGCKHCYAKRMAHRLQAMRQPRYKNGFRLTLQGDLVAKGRHGAVLRGHAITTEEQHVHADLLQHVHAGLVDERHGATLELAAEPDDLWSFGRGKRAHDRDGVGDDDQVAVPMEQVGQVQCGAAGIDDERAALGHLREGSASDSPLLVGEDRHAGIGRAQPAEIDVPEVGRVGTSARRRPSVFGLLHFLACELFGEMLQRFKNEVVSILSKIQIRSEAEVAAMEEQRRRSSGGDMQFQHEEAAAMASSEESEEHAKPFVREGRKVGRNEPCPCGSGKKYKQCHGKLS